jgi:hypothetical protein
LKFRFNKRGNNRFENHIGKHKRNQNLFTNHCKQKINKISLWRNRKQAKFCFESCHKRKGTRILLRIITKQKINEDNSSLEKISFF